MVFLNLRSKEMREEGELSDSSESFHSFELPSSTTHPLPAIPNRTSSNRLSLQDVERSYIDMYLMDTDSGVAATNGGNGGVQSTGQPKGWAAAQRWQRMLMQDADVQPKPSDRSNKKAVIRANPRPQRVVIIDPKSPAKTNNKQQPAVTKKEVKKEAKKEVKKAVFINHRRLEKRELGQYVVSPPKPAEVKLDQKEVSEYAVVIASALKEKRKDIIQKIIDACGILKSSQLCTEAQLIYNTTGMLTLVGTPRSLGGCFFQLVKMKGDLSESQKREIFYEPTAKFSLHKKQMKNAKKKKQKLKKTQEELRKVFEKMNLDIHVSINQANTS